MASPLQETPDHSTLQSNISLFSSDKEREEIIIALALERIFQRGFITFNQNVSIDSFTAHSLGYPLSIYEVVAKALKKESYKLCIVPSSSDNVKKGEDNASLVHVALLKEIRYK